MSARMSSAHRVGAAMVAALALAAISAESAHAAPPPNDDWANAEELSGPLPITTTGTNAEATLEPGEQTPFTGGASVWYSWTPTTDDPATLDLCGSDFDTVVGVYTGEELINLALEGGDDDACGTVGAGSKVTLTAPTAGTTYWIAVDGFQGATGTISLKVRQPTPPANDDFVDAEELTGEPPIIANGSNVEASAEPGEPDHAGIQGGASIWYRWTPDATAQVEVDNCGGVIQGGPIAVYTGAAVDALTEVTSGNGNDICPGFSDGTRVSFTATAGETYMIALDGYGGSAITTQGTARLRLFVIDPPGNDDFADSKLVSGALPLTDTGTTVGATKEVGEPDHAGNPGGASVWYRWIPETGGPVTINTCGSSFDTLLGIYTGTEVGALSEVASNDDGTCGPQSRVEFEAEAGETYRIAVDGFRGSGEVSRGSISLAIDRVHEPPPNDDFESAEVVSGALPVEVEGVNLGATKQPGEPNHAGNAGGASVWYEWTPEASEQVAIDTCGADFDTLMGVYTGAELSGLSEIAGDDDGCGEGGAGSLVTFMAEAGITYWIAVDGWSPPFPDPATGHLVLRIAPGEGRPPNDDFADAEELEGALPITVEGSNVRGTKEPGEPDHAGDPGGASVWYRWTAETGGPVTVGVCESGFDTLLAVYTGSALDDLSLLESRDSSDIDPEYGGCSVSFRALAGETYRIAVDGSTDVFSRRRGAFTLRLRTASAPLNDDFAAARQLDPRAPIVVTGVNVEATKEAGEPDHAGDPGGASVWYRWTPSVSGPVTVAVCNTRFDNLLAVYTGAAVDDLDLVVSNAFGCEVGLTVEAGETYAIAVDGFRDPTGAIARGELELVIRRANPPPNDDFADAEVLEGALPIETTGTNVDATKSAVEPNHDGNRGGASVWYRWTPATSGTAAIDLCESGFDTVLAVYTGTDEDSLSTVASNDEGCGGSRGSRIPLGVTAGTTYWIAVDGFFGNTGRISLRIHEPPAADGSAGCGVGERALGGGAGSVAAGPVQSHSHTLQASAPAGPDEVADGDVATGWGTSVVNHTSSPQNHRILTVCSSSADATVEAEPLTVPANAAGDGLATCAAGTRVVGGGVLAPETSGRQKHSVQATSPVNDSGLPLFTNEGDVAVSWHASVANHTNAEQTYTVYALCSAASDATVAAEQFAATNGEVADGVAICPTGRNALGGGITPFNTDDRHLNTVQASAPVDTSLSVAGTEAGDTPRAWYGAVANRLSASGATPFRAVALCGTLADATVAATPLEVPLSRPQNDDLADAHPLEGELPLRVKGTNRRATKEPGEPDHAGNPGGASVWFRWTAPDADPVTLATCGSDLDTLLGVYTGTDVGGLTEVTGNDDACGAQSRVTFTPTAGEAYRIAVDGNRVGGAAATGAVVLRVYEAGAPANDNLDAAEAITGSLPIKVAGHNLTATEEPGEPDHAGDPGGASVWYRWLAGADGPVAVETCRSDFDTALGIYTGTQVSALTEVAANDDACGEGSRLAFQARAGESYLIAVDGQRRSAPAPDTGSIELRLRAAHPPLNDPFASPEDLTGELPIAIEDSNFDATREPGEPPHGGPGGASLWYRWTAETDARVAIETCGTDFDTLLGVYQGTALGSLTEVGTDDDSCGGASRVLFDAQAGEIYRIALDTKRAAPGIVTLRIESSSATPAAPALEATEPDSPANDNKPKVIGTAPGAATVSVYLDDPACAGSAEATGSAAEFEGSGIAVDVPDDAATEIRAKAFGPAGNASPCSEPLTYVEDSTPPAPPKLSGTTPASPADDNTPRVFGDAEPESTVRLYANGSCTGAATSTGPASALASPGISVRVADNATTQISARSIDAAGNASACSEPIAYVERSSRRCHGEPATMTGTKGNDVLVGTRGPDVIVAAGGDDVVRGLKGEDLVCGGGGNDTLRGGPGADELRGERGRDLLIGGRGADALAGGPGRDEERR